MEIPSSSTEKLWRGNVNGSGGWATVIALLLILIWHINRRFFFNRPTSSTLHATVSSASTFLDPQTPIPSISDIVSDAYLKALIDNLDDGKLSEPNITWDTVIDKRHNNFSYSAKCCKPKDGPLKYLSVTTFEDCSTEMLRDFYLDNDYRKLWDKTIFDHEQLQVDEISGTEIGRTIKKFPLLTPREYVLAWRLWEDEDKTFYCFIKECEHPLVPQQKKYVRVRFFRSGWRIRKVPGRNASEIKLVHQEDAGLNVEMAKLAFSKGIWSYLCKMNNALRKYHAMHTQLNSALTAVTLIQKVPAGINTMKSMTCQVGMSSVATSIHGQACGEGREKKVSRRPSRKLVANGLLVLGGVICLSRGHSSLGAKVAMAYILTKLSKRGAASCQSKEVEAP